MSILHSVFIKGVTINFDLGEDDIEASALYPDMRFSTIDELLDVFLNDPPEPVKSGVFPSFCSPLDGNEDL